MLSEAILVLKKNIRHKNGLVRKGCVFLLKLPKFVARINSIEEDYFKYPPVFINAFPKSGTHLLDQILSSIPGKNGYGAFLASLTSSYKFRLRTKKEILSIIDTVVPNEVFRGHLFYSEDVSKALQKKNIINYFIYRDPRDVVVSESYYLRNINKWHKLHPYFKASKNVGEAINIAIKGIEGGDFLYPSIRERFEDYIGWLEDPYVYSVKYEDLLSDYRDDKLQEMIDHYRRNVDDNIGLNIFPSDLRKGIRPSRSHTFRKGRVGDWSSVFTEEQKFLFKDVAGSLLIELGYEKDYNW